MNGVFISYCVQVCHDLSYFPDNRALRRFVLARFSLALRAALRRHALQRRRSGSAGIVQLSHR